MKVHQYRKPCARTGCTRNMWAAHSNRMGLCHKCLEMVDTVEWLLTGGAIRRTDSGLARALGLELPHGS